MFKLYVNKLNAISVQNVAFLDPFFVFSEATLDIFALTPGFVPTPRSNSARLLLSQVADFVRKLQWRSAFNFSSEPPRFSLPPSTRWPPTQCVPPHILRLSKKILQGSRGLCRKYSQFHFPSNLSQAQLKEVSRLSSGPSVITTADKGGRWTVVPRSAYVSEASRQLSNGNFYKPIDQPPLTVRSRLTQLIDHLKKRKFINVREHAFFVPNDSCSDTRHFKLLPKLHKVRWPDPYMPPGRPIVSDVGSITRNVGDLVDHFLQPLCKKLASHLKDTQHLIAIIRNTTPSSGAILFTLDVESLYTNIPIGEGLAAVSSAFLRHPDQKRPDLTLLSLLRIILGSNNFSFQGQEWLQTHGVAMGKPFGGSFANLFMGQWEERALSSFSHPTSLWVRYQDDVFGVWEHGADLLQDFLKHLNGRHPSIKLSLQFGPSVNFLDLRISLRNGELIYAPFFKETDGHLILPPASHHPTSTFTGLLYGEIFRFASHSSSRESFQKTLQLITPVWRSQGFTRSQIRLARSRVLTNTGQQQLWSTGMFPCGSSSCPSCPFANFTSVFLDLTSSLSFPIFQSLTCLSFNVIYVIECSHCSKRYVGQTSTFLRRRISQHISNVRSLSHNSVLSQHFRSQCGLSNFSFFAIARYNNQATRLAKEAAWIARLDTLAPKGLNDVTHSEPQPTNLVLPYNALSSRVTSAIRSWLRHHPMRVSYTRSRNLGELLSSSSI